MAKRTTPKADASPRVGVDFSVEVLLESTEPVNDEILPWIELKGKIDYRDTGMFVEKRIPNVLKQLSDVISSFEKRDYPQLVEIRERAIKLQAEFVRQHEVAIRNGVGIQEARAELQQVNDLLQTINNPKRDRECELNIERLKENLGGIPTTFSIEDRVREIEAEIALCVERYMTPEEQSTWNDGKLVAYYTWRKNLARAKMLCQHIRTAIEANESERVIALAHMLGIEMATCRLRRNFEHIVAKAKKQASPLAQQRAKQRAEFEACRMESVTELMRLHAQFPKKKKKPLTEEMEKNWFGNYWTLKKYFLDIHLHPRKKRKK